MSHERPYSLEGLIGFSQGGFDGCAYVWGNIAFTKAALFRRAVERNPRLCTALFGEEQGLVGLDTKIADFVDLLTCEGHRSEGFDVRSPLCDRGIDVEFSESIEEEHGVVSSAITAAHQKCDDRDCADGDEDRGENEISRAHRGGTPVLRRTRRRKWDQR